MKKLLIVLLTTLMCVGVFQVNTKKIVAESNEFICRQAPSSPYLYVKLGNSYTFNFEMSGGTAPYTYTFKKQLPGSEEIETLDNRQLEETKYSYAADSIPDDMLGGKYYFEATDANDNVYTWSTEIKDVTKETYNYNFSGNGAVGTEPEGGTIQGGSEITLPSQGNLYRGADFIFTGWESEAKKYLPGEKIMMDRDRTFSAKWEEDVPLIYDVSNGKFYIYNPSTSGTDEVPTPFGITVSQDFKTLTFNNFNLELNCDMYEKYASRHMAALEIINGDVTINLAEGSDNNITTWTNSENYIEHSLAAIKSDNKVTFTGSGKLSLLATSNQQYVKCYTLDVQQLIMSDDSSEVEATNNNNSNFGAISSVLEPSLASGMKVYGKASLDDTEAKYETADLAKGESNYSYKVDGKNAKHVVIMKKESNQKECEFQGGAWEDNKCTCPEGRIWKDTHGCRKYYQVTYSSGGLIGDVPTDETKYFVDEKIKAKDIEPGTYAESGIFGGWGHYDSSHGSYKKIPDEGFDITDTWEYAMGDTNIYLYPINISPQATLVYTIDPNTNTGKFTINTNNYGTITLPSVYGITIDPEDPSHLTFSSFDYTASNISRDNAIGIKFNDDVRITLEGANKIQIFYENIGQTVETPAYAIYSEHNITFDGSGTLQITAEANDYPTYTAVTGIKAKQIIIDSEDENPPTIEISASKYAVETTGTLPKKTDTYFVYGKTKAYISSEGNDLPVEEATAVQVGDIYTYQIGKDAVKRVLFTTKHTKETICVNTGGTYSDNECSCPFGESYRSGFGCKASYKVVYDGSGYDAGTVPEDKNDYFLDDTITVKGNTGGIKKTASQFNGWFYDDKDGNQIFVEPGDTIKVDEKLSSEIRLNANWETNTIVYDASEGKFYYEYYEDESLKLKPLVTPLGITINNDKSLTFNGVVLSTENDVSFKIINGDVTIHLSGDNEIVQLNNSSAVTLIDAGSNNITIDGAGNLKLRNAYSSSYATTGIKCNKLNIGDSSNNVAFTGTLNIYLTSNGDREEVSTGINTTGLISVYGEATVIVDVADIAVKTSEAIKLESTGLNIHGLDLSGSGEGTNRHFVLEFDEEDGIYKLINEKGTQKACQLRIDGKYVVGYWPVDNKYYGNIYAKNEEITVLNDTSVPEGEFFFGWENQDKETYAGNSKLVVTKNHVFKSIHGDSNFTLVYDMDTKKFYRNSVAAENVISTPAGITVDSYGNLEFNDYHFQTNQPVAFKVVGSGGTLTINLKNNSSIYIQKDSSELMSEETSVIDTLDYETGENSVSLKFTGDGYLDIRSSIANSSNSYGIKTNSLIMSEKDFTGILTVNMENFYEEEPTPDTVGIYLDGTLTLSGGSLKVYTPTCAIIAPSTSSFATKNMLINAIDKEYNSGSPIIKEIGDKYTYYVKVEDDENVAASIEASKMETNTIVFDTDQKCFVDNATDKKPVDPPDGITIPTAGVNTIQIDDLDYTMYNAAAALKVIGSNPLTISISERPKESGNDYHVIRLDNRSTDIKEIVGLDSDVDITVTGAGYLTIVVDNYYQATGTKATGIKLESGKTLTFDENFTGFVLVNADSNYNDRINDGIGTILSTLKIDSTSGFVRFNGSKVSGEFGTVTLAEKLKSVGNDPSKCFDASLDRIATFQDAAHRYYVVDDNEQTAVTKALCFGPLYRITYEKNYEETELGNLPNPSNFLYPDDKSISVDSSELTTETYDKSFVHWIDQNGQEYKPYQEITTLTDDLILKPVWVDNTFTLIYDTQKGEAYRSDTMEEIPMPYGVYPVDGYKPDHITLDGFKFKTTAPTAFKFINGNLTVALREGSENIVETTTDASEPGSEFFAAITDDGKNRNLTVEGRGSLSASIKTTDEEEKLTVFGIHVGSFSTVWDGYSNISVSALATNKIADSSYFGVYTYGKDNSGNSFYINNNNNIVIRAQDNAVQLSTQPNVHEDLNISGDKDVVESLTGLGVAYMSQKGSPYYYDTGDGETPTKTLMIGSVNENAGFTILYNADDGKFYTYTEKDAEGKPTRTVEIPEEQLSQSGLSRDENDFYKIKLNNVDFETTAGSGLELYSSDVTKEFTVELAGESSIKVTPSTINDYDLAAGIGAINSVKFVGDGKLTVDIDAETSKYVIGIGSQKGTLTFGTSGSSNESENQFTGAIKIYCEGNKNYGIGLYGCEGFNVHGTGSIVSYASDFAVQSEKAEPVVDKTISINGLYDEIREFSPAKAVEITYETPFWTYVLPSYGEIASVIAFGEIPETINDYTLVYIPDMPGLDPGFYVADENISSPDDLIPYKNGVPNGITIDKDNPYHLIFEGFKFTTDSAEGLVLASVFNNPITIELKGSNEVNVISNLMFGCGIDGAYTIYDADGSPTDLSCGINFIGSGKLKITVTQSDEVIRETAGKVYSIGLQAQGLNVGTKDNAFTGELDIEAGVQRDDSLGSNVGIGITGSKGYFNVYGGTTKVKASYAAVGFDSQKSTYTTSGVVVKGSKSLITDPYQAVTKTWNDDYEQGYLALLDEQLGPTYPVTNLLIKKEQSTFKVNYINTEKTLNDGEPPVDATDYSTGQKATIKGNIGTDSDPKMIVDGKYFAGWQDTSGKVYKPGDVVEIGTDDLTLYAVWNPVDFSLIYDNGKLYTQKDSSSEPVEVKDFDGISITQAGTNYTLNFDNLYLSTSVANGLLIKSPVKIKLNGDNYIIGSTSEANSIGIKIAANADVVVEGPGTLICGGVTGLESSSTVTLTKASLYAVGAPAKFSANGVAMKFDTEGKTLVLSDKYSRAVATAQTAISSLTKPNVPNTLVVQGTNDLNTEGQIPEPQSELVEVTFNETNHYYEIDNKGTKEIAQYVSIGAENKTIYITRGLDGNVGLYTDSGGSVPYKEMKNDKKWSVEGNTVTFKDGFDFESAAEYSIEVLEDVKIHIDGTVNITNNSGDRDSIVIESYDHELVFEGTGTLNINTSIGNGAIGIDAKSISVDTTKININSYGSSTVDAISMGIYFMRADSYINPWKLQLVKGATITIENKNEETKTFYPIVNSEINLSNIATYYKDKKQVENHASMYEAKVYGQTVYSYTDNIYADKIAPSNNLVLKENSEAPFNFTIEYDGADIYARIDSCRRLIPNEVASEFGLEAYKSSISNMLVLKDFNFETSADVGLLLTGKTNVLKLVSDEPKTTDENITNIITHSSSGKAAALALYGKYVSILPGDNSNVYTLKLSTVGDGKSAGTGIYIENDKDIEGSYTTDPIELDSKTKIRISVGGNHENVYSTNPIMYGVNAQYDNGSSVLVSASQKAIQDNNYTYVDTNGNIIKNLLLTKATDTDASNYTLVYNMLDEGGYFSALFENGLETPLSTVFVGDELGIRLPSKIKEKQNYDLIIDGLKGGYAGNSLITTAKTGLLIRDLSGSETPRVARILVNARDYEITSNTTAISYDNDIVISGTGNLVLDSGVGIQANSLTVDGVDIEIEGNTGIKCKGDIYFDGNTVDVKALDVGIGATNLHIGETELNVTSNGNAIYATKMIIEDNNATINASGNDSNKGAIVTGALEFDDSVSKGNFFVKGAENNVPVSDSDYSEAEFSTDHFVIRKGTEEPATYVPAKAIKMNLLDVILIYTPSMSANKTEWKLYYAQANASSSAQPAASIRDFDSATACTDAGGIPLKGGEDDKVPCICKAGQWNDQNKCVKQEEQLPTELTEAQLDALGITYSGDNNEVLIMKDSVIVTKGRVGLLVYVADDESNDVTAPTLSIDGNCLIKSTFIENDGGASFDPVIVMGEAIQKVESYINGSTSMDMLSNVSSRGLLVYGTDLTINKAGTAETTPVLNVIGNKYGVDADGQNITIQDVDSRFEGANIDNDKTFGLYAQKLVVSGDGKVTARGNDFGAEFEIYDEEIKKPFDGNIRGSSSYDSSNPSSKIEEYHDESMGSTGDYTYYVYSTDGKESSIPALTLVFEPKKESDYKIQVISSPAGEILPKIGDKVVYSAAEGAKIKFYVDEETKTEGTLTGYTIKYTIGKEEKTETIGVDEEFTMPAADIEVTVNFESATHNIKKVCDEEIGYISFESEEHPYVANEIIVFYVNIYEPDKYIIRKLSATYKDKAGVTQDISIRTSDFAYIITVPKDIAANEDITLTVQFKPKDSYNVTAVKPTGGDVKILNEFGDPMNAFNEGDNVIVKFVPAEGYTYSDVKLTVKDKYGNTIETNNFDDAARFVMPQSDVTVETEYQKLDYGISIDTEITHGTITVVTAGNTDNRYTFGQTIVFKVEPEDEHYSAEAVEVKDWDDNDVTVTPTGNENEYQFTMPANDVTISANIVGKTKYRINVAESEGGTVSTEGNITQAANGDKVSLVVKPDDGYKLKSITYTYGTETTDVTYDEEYYEYYFTMPADAVTVNAVFEKEEYTISKIIDVEIEGAIKTGEVQIDTEQEAVEGKVKFAYGDKVTIKLVPNTGYQSSDKVVIKDGDVPVYKVEDSETNTVTGNDQQTKTFYFNMPAYNIEDDDVVTNFIETPKFKIVVENPGTGGSLVVDGGITEAAAGDQITVKTPIKNGYTVEQIVYKYKDTGGTLHTETIQNPGTGEYQFTMPELYPDTVLTISTEFKPQEFEITSKKIDHGTLTIKDGPTGSAITKAEVGSKVYVEVTPDTEYAIQELIVSGATCYHYSGNIYVFTMPASAVDVSAVFDAVPKNKIIIVDPGNDVGTITAKKNDVSVVEAVMGSTINLTATPKAGYEFNSWEVTDADENPVTVEDNSFTMPGKYVTVKGIFGKMIYAIQTEEAPGGNISVNNSACAGDTVKITITPNQSYKLVSLSIVTTKEETVPFYYDDLNKTYDFVMPTDGVVVTPMFAENSNSISVDNNEAGGKITADAINAVPGQKINLTISNIPEGYVFKKWVVKSGTSSVSVENAYIQTGASFTMPSNPVVVTCEYTKQTKITFEKGEGATGGTDNVLATTGLELPAINVPTKTGYTFLGYFASEEENALKYYSSNGSSTQQWTSEQPEATLYAHWEKTNYTITDSNEKTNGEVKTLIGGTPTSSATYGDVITLQISPAEGKILKSGTLKVINVTSGSEVSITNNTFEMPASNVKIEYEFEDDLNYYGIEVNSEGYGTTTISGDTEKTAKYNTSITVTTTPAPGYILNSLTVDGTDVTSKVDKGVYKFNMPTHNVVIKSKYIEDTNEYNIEIPTFTNGKVEASKSKSRSNQQIVLTVTPDDTFRLDTISLNTGTTLNITERGKTYYFQMPSSNVTVNATFTEDIKRTLVFDSKGGSTVPSREVSVGLEYGELPKPSKLGSNFNGWWTTETDESSTDNRVSSETKMVTGTGDVTIYAHWNNNKDATITLDGNGGKPATQEVMMPYGSKLGKFEKQEKELARTGYIFKQWNVKGEEHAYDPESTLPEKGITLVAQWDPITYTITFDGNGATSGEMADMPMKYDVADDLTSNAFAKTGHHFVEWKDLATNLVYADEAEVNNLTEKDKTEITLQAQWAANTFKVEYIANNTGTSGTMTTSDHTYGTTSALTQNAFTKPGYHFTGWNTKYDGSGIAFTDKQDMTSYVTDDKSTIKLYAQWEANKYQINYDGNGATSGSTASSTHTYGQSEKLTTNGFAKKGYYFNNWLYNSSYYNNGVYVSNLTTGTDPITFTAQWLPITYTVIYDSNGATGGAKMSGALHTYDVDKNLSVNTYTKDGYKFAGWKDADGTTYTDGQSVKNLSSTMGGIVTLTAQWTPVSGIVVTLNDAPGSGGQGTTTATYLSEMTKLTQLPTRTGYKFAGYQDANGTKYFDESGNCVKAWDKTSAATLSAIWTPITYTIKFNPGTGTGVMKDLTLTYDSNTGRLTACSFTNPGYRFVNWTGSDGNTYTDNQLVKNLTDVDGQVITLTANWSAVTYTVNLSGNGGSGATTTKINIANNAQFNDLEGNMPTRDGYTFIGYYDTNTLTPTSTKYFDKDGKVVDSATWSKAGDGTLYALWEGVVHTKPAVPTQPDHGTVSFDDGQEYKTGKEVKITITPDNGYKIKSVKGTYGTDDKEIITIINKQGERSFIMPNADNVKVSVTFEVDANVKFNVSYDTFVNGNVTASKTNIPAETENSLNVVPATGYQLKAGTLKVINNTTRETVTLNDKAFTMPNSDVTVKAEFEPNQDIKQSIIKGSLVNGAITAITDKDNNNITETYVENQVILTVEPDAGYKLDTITATYNDGKTTKTITPTLVSGTTNKYSFDMPAYKVTVNATFAVDTSTTTKVSIKTGITNGVVELKDSSKTDYYVTEEVPLLVKPAEGYRVDTITATYTGKAGTQTITPKFVEKTKDGLIYTFNMPGYATEVDATFAKQEATSYYATRATADDGYSIKEVYMSMKNSGASSTTTTLEMRGNPSNAYTTIIRDQIKITQPTEIGEDVIGVEVVDNPNDPNQPKQIKITAKHTTEVKSEAGEIIHYPAIVEVPIKNINNEPIYKVTFKVYVTSEVETSSEDYIKGSSQLPTQATDDELKEFLDDPSDPVDSGVADGCYVRLDKDEEEAQLTKSTSTVDGHYAVKEGSVRITLLPKILDTLDVGEHILYVKTKTGLHEIHFFVKAAPSPGPGPDPSPGKYESCEKLYGPTWHWNESKGICEETGVVHTYSR